MPPPRKQEPPHLLEFATNSLRNTTISVDNDEHYYEVVTRFWHPETTKIFKLDPESRQLNLVAEIDRLKSKQPRIRFGGEQGRWMEESEFLQWDEGKRYVPSQYFPCQFSMRKLNAISWFSEAVFTGAQGVEYRWKSHHRRLQASSRSRPYLKV